MNRVVRYINFRSIRIHSWGGFGSQLNALCFALSVKQLWPWKRVILVLHTSGVTFRGDEITSFLPKNIDYEIVDDYAEKTKPVERKRKVKFFTYVLDFTGLTIFPSLKSEISRVRPWTTSSRSSYTLNLIEDDTLIKLEEVIYSQTSLTTHLLGVMHYRLGDLLVIQKGHIDPYLLRKVIMRTGVNDWLIHTDSPAEAKELLSGSGFRKLHISFPSSSSIQVLRDGIESKTFIGTNSKLSLWISIFRCFMTLPNTFMPLTLKETLSFQIPAERIKLITFYD